MKPLLIMSAMIALLMMMFLAASKKNKFESTSSTSFECGFSSYYYSRFSFSIHFFTVGLTFLLLDLELCTIMPMMTESHFSAKKMMNLSIFTFMLLCTMLAEWATGKIEWKF